MFLIFVKLDEAVIRSCPFYLRFVLPTDMRIVVFGRFVTNVQCAGVGIMKKKVCKITIFNCKTIETRAFSRSTAKRTKKRYKKVVYLNLTFLLWYWVVFFTLRNLPVLCF